MLRILTTIFGNALMAKILMTENEKYSNPAENTSTREILGSDIFEELHPGKLIFYKMERNNLFPQPSLTACSGWIHTAIRCRVTVVDTTIESMMSYHMWKARVS